MRLLKSQALLWVLLVFLSGCAFTGTPAPETDVERLDVAESVYGAMLSRAIVLRDAGEFSDSQIKKITKSFDDYEDGRKLARDALDVVGGGDFNTQLGRINAALKVLTILVDEVE